MHCRLWAGVYLQLTDGKWGDMLSPCNMFYPDFITNAHILLQGMDIDLKWSQWMGTTVNVTWGITFAVQLHGCGMCTAPSAYYIKLTRLLLLPLPASVNLKGLFSVEDFLGGSSSPAPSQTFYRSTKLLTLVVPKIQQ